MSFPLVVLIPHEMLAPCFAVQPRPLWEKKLVYITFPVWVGIVIVVTFLELIGISFRFSFRSRDPALPAVQPTGGAKFDLKDLTRTDQGAAQGAAHGAFQNKLECLKRRLVMPLAVYCVLFTYMFLVLYRIHKCIFLTH